MFIYFYFYNKFLYWLYIYIIYNMLILDIYNIYVKLFYIRGKRWIGEVVYFCGNFYFTKRWNLSSVFEVCYDENFYILVRGCEWFIVF